MIEFLKGTITPIDWVAFAAIIGVAIALAVGFTFFINAQHQEEIVALTAQNAQIEKDLEFAREQERNIEALRRETREIQTIVEEFEERLPRSREIPRLAQQFEAIAAEEDVDVELKSLPRTRDEKKETIPYNVIARGDYHQVVSFINRLERFKRYLKISDLEVKLLEDSLLSEAKFVLSTYAFIKNTPKVS